MMNGDFNVTMEIMQMTLLETHNVIFVVGLLTFTKSKFWLDLASCT